jgi:hypothetical protein
LELAATVTPVFLPDQEENGSPEPIDLVFFPIGKK